MEELPALHLQANLISRSVSKPGVQIVTNVVHLFAHGSTIYHARQNGTICLSAVAPYVSMMIWSFVAYTAVLFTTNILMNGIGVDNRI